MDYIYIGLLVAVIAIETIAQFFLQKMVDTNGKHNLALGIIFYAFGGYLYYLLLKRGTKLPIANGWRTAGTYLTVIVMAVFIFEQRLTIKELLGISIN